MSSRRGLRKRRGGMTSLEALIAFVAVSSASVVFIMVLTQSIRREVSALQTLWAHELARSVLDEQLLAFPNEQQFGEVAGRWSWEVSVAELSAPIPSTASDDMRFYQMSVLVTGITGDEGIGLSQLLVKQR